jgi:hypothetical protein
VTPRLTSAMLVGALVRRVFTQGGTAAVLMKGDATAGAILLICMERGVVQSIRERVLDRSGRYAWAVVGPSAPAEISGYVAKRKESDGDLWVVELDIANAERFAAEMG